MNILILAHQHPLTKMHFTENDLRNLLRSRPTVTHIIVDSPLYGDIESFPRSFSKDSTLYYAIGYDRKPIAVHYSADLTNSVHVETHTWGND